MKNLKKVLALAVAFVMCFTMFAGAAVFSDVPVGGDYSEAITFLSDLQIIAGKPDGTFGVNDAITRADAACLIARMMTGQQNPPKYDNHVAFSDVPVGSYYEAAVGYCAALGVTSGTGGGKFSPMKTITDGEFVAMLTRALGYDTPENPLQFPMGNITVAQSKGLLDGVSINYMSDALRGEDAQMLYNAVFADYDREAKNKNVYQSADDHYNVTIAEAVFDLARYSFDSNWKKDDNVDAWDFHGSYKQAAHKCTAHTWVIAGVDAREKQNEYVAFAIDDDEEKPIPHMDSNGKFLTDTENEGAYIRFTYDGDVKPLIGYRVELWGEMDHPGKEPAIVAIKALDGQTVTNWNPGIFDGETNNKVKVDDKTLIMTRDQNVAYAANLNLQKNNWETVKPENNAYTLAVAYEKDADDCQYTSAYPRNMYIVPADGDQYRFYDWDSDNKIDFVVRDTYKYGEVKSVSKSRVVIEAVNAHTQVPSQYALKLGESDLVVQGADNLSEGDVVEISVTDRVFDAGEAAEAVTITLAQVEPESKTLEKMNLTKDTYTFDGEELTLAEKDIFDLVEENDTMEDMRTKENVGQAFNIYFDRSGFILKAKVTDDSARGYLMVLDTVDGNGDLTSNKKRDLAALDVLFDDNTTQNEVPVVSDLKIRVGGSGSWASTGNGYTKRGRTWDQLKVVGNVYKYYMNKDGEITRLDEQTLYNSTDYSFDNSKDRISIRRNDVEGAPDRTYNVDDDAVIFAVRADDTTSKDPDGRGYVRVKAGATNDHPYHGARYYVDAEDVVAVKADEVPEIDNRRANSNAGWDTLADWKDDDVTHPSVFLKGDISLGFARTYDPATTTYTDTKSWMDYAVDQVQSWAQNDVAAAGKTEGVPAMSYNLDNDENEVTVAVLGVDTLDYFNQSSVKVALITDVNYHGSDSYSIDAAIDGQVANFKTIADDEESIFVGRLDSVSAMDSYLNQNRRTDRDGNIAGDASKEGAGYGLYAEVTMNSDGLITKVRAMDYVTEANSKWDGSNPSRTAYFEGNVYRVIRGVVTDIRAGSKATSVSWQTNPVASVTDLDDGEFIYTLREYDNHNLYDTLEGDYDSDTFFYEVKKRPALEKDKKVTVYNSFHKDLGNGGLKAADSNILEKSVFIDKDEDAAYYLADFAVRKSDTDALVAVFAFTKTLTNKGKSEIVYDNADVKGYLTIGNSPYGYVASEPMTYTIELKELKNAALNKTVTFTFTDNTGNTEELRVPVNTSDSESRFLADLANALEGKDSKIAVTTKDNVLTVTGGHNTDGTVRSFKIEQTNLADDCVLEIKKTADGSPDAVTTNAKSTITVKNTYYSFTRDQEIEFSGAKGVLTTAVTITVPRGDYTAAEFAKEIKDQLDAESVTDLVVTVKDAVVTIEDTSTAGWINDDIIDLGLDITFKAN